MGAAWKPREGRLKNEKMAGTVATEPIFEGNEALLLAGFPLEGTHQRA
jgi:hypothetical protein